jgi:hypothetical protein
MLPVSCVAYRKFAVTLRLELIVTLIGLFVPVTPPLQPIQGEPAAGVAVNVTTVPGA